MGNIAKNLDSKFDLNATRNDGALGFFQRASPPNNNNKKKKISSVWGPVPGPKKQVESAKHKKGLSDIAKSKTESQTILECLQRRDKRENVAGSSLPANMRLFRFEVVESFLRAGIPLAKLDVLRPLLKRHGQRLTSRSHMNEFIPVVLEKEKNILMEELKDVKETSVIFDGTARLGEALVIIICYIPGELCTYSTTHTP